MRHPSALLTAAVLVLATTTAGCDAFQEPPQGVVAVNKTPYALRFTIISGDHTYELHGAFPPGETNEILSDSALGPDSLLAANRCTNGDIVALDAAGKEIARHAPALCSGDRWITSIGADGASAAASATPR